MGKGIYIGVENVAREAKEIYIGAPADDGNGVARKVTHGYVGVDGVARNFLSPSVTVKVTGDGSYTTNTGYTQNVASFFIGSDFYVGETTIEVELGNAIRFTLYCWYDGPAYLTINGETVLEVTASDMYKKYEYVVTGPLEIELDTVYSSSLLKPKGYGIIRITEKEMEQ